MNIRICADERAEAFTSLLWEGVHEYSYFARATTPGLFVVPRRRLKRCMLLKLSDECRANRVRVK
jgi:hypothetical protein